MARLWPGTAGRAHGHDLAKMWLCGLQQRICSTICTKVQQRAQFAFYGDSQRYITRVGSCKTDTRTSSGRGKPGCDEATHNLLQSQALPATQFR